MDHDMVTKIKVLYAVRMDGDTAPPAARMGGIRMSGDTIRTGRCEIRMDGDIATAKKNVSYIVSFLRTCLGSMSQAARGSRSKWGPAIS